jgi:hypothetical protein
MFHTQHLLPPCKPLHVGSIRSRPPEAAAKYPTSLLPQNPHLQMCRRNFAAGFYRAASILGADFWLRS